MATRHARKRPHSRGLPVPEQRAKWCARLDDALAKLAVARHLKELETPEGRAKVLEGFRALRTAREKSSEWDIAWGLHR